MAVFRFDKGIFVNDEGQLESSVDYTGFDMVVVVNVTSIDLPMPKLGIILPGSTENVERDLVIGGLGETTELTSLPKGAAWATLVPETDELKVNASLSFAGLDVDPTTPLEGQLLHRGTSPFTVEFVTASKPSMGTEADVQGLEAIAISLDGEHIYGVHGDQSVLIVANAHGLSQRQLLKEGLNDPYGAAVTGLEGASDIAIADGVHVYVVSPTMQSVAIFDREDTGDLAFRHAVTNPGKNVFETLAVSQDGTRLFVAGQDGIAIYARNADQADADFGSLTLLTEPTTAGGVADFSEVAPSADGSLLYAVSQAHDTLLVLDADTLEVQQSLSGAVNGLNGASDVVVDGAFVYVTAQDGNTLSVFQHDTSTNDLSHLQTLRSGVEGVRGILQPTDVALTPDQQYVLVTGALSDAVAVFERDLDTGKLQFVQVLRNNIGGTTGLETPRVIVTSSESEGYQIFVGSGGDSHTPGGLVAFDKSTSQPEATQLLTTFENIESLRIETGAGADTLSLSVAPGPEVAQTTIETRANDDIVTLLDLSPMTKVVMGDDDDLVQVRTETSGAELVIYGDEEQDWDVNCHDTIEIEMVGAFSRTEVFGGPGRDVFKVSGSNLPESSTTIVHGNDPDTATDGDTLIFDPQDPDSTLEPPPGEGVVQIEGRGTLTYDTLEGDVVIAQAPIIAFAGEPFEVVEGGTVTLNVSVTPFGSTGALSGPVTWDLNGDGIFAEGTATNWS